MCVCAWPGAGTKYFWFFTLSTFLGTNDMFRWWTQCHCNYTVVDMLGVWNGGTIRDGVYVYCGCGLWSRGSPDDVSPVTV